MTKGLFYSYDSSSIYNPYIETQHLMIFNDILIQVENESIILCQIESINDVLFIVCVCSCVDCCWHK
jgi:hypothetical protein